MFEAEDKEAPPPAEVTTGNTQQVQGGSTPVASVQPAAAATTTTEDEDESEDESEILEESPCGRWQKRREEVRLQWTGQEAVLRLDQGKDVGWTLNCSNFYFT